MRDKKIESLPRYEQRGYYLGRIEFANEWIKTLQAIGNSQYIKKEIKKATELRDESMRKLKALG